MKLSEYSTGTALPARVEPLAREIVPSAAAAAALNRQHGAGCLCLRCRTSKVGGFSATDVGGLAGLGELVQVVT
jgi:hypothetical protein